MKIAAHEPTPAADPIRPIEVLHVLEATLAGTRRHVHDLITALHDLGAPQGIAYSMRRADSGFRSAVADFKKQGVICIPLDMERAINPVADLRASWRLRRIIKKHRPRLIHLHSSKAGALGRIAALGIPNLQVVYTPHASPANISSMYLWIERALARMRTSAIIAISESERDELLRLRIAHPSKVRLIHNGIDQGQPLESCKEQKLGDQPLVLGMGRLTRQKNPELLVSASELVLHEMPTARFVWVGDGELRDRIETLITEAGISKSWTITGWLSNPMTQMVGASLFVLPSLYEGLPYSIIEAMALGLPVVATSVTGSKDLVIPGVTGELVPSNDPGKLAEAIIEIVSDQTIRENMGAAARERAKHFTRARMAQNTLDLYRSFI